MAASARRNGERLRQLEGVVAFRDNCARPDDLVPLHRDEDLTPGRDDPAERVAEVFLVPVFETARSLHQPGAIERVERLGVGGRKCLDRTSTIQWHRSDCGAAMGVNRRVDSRSSSPSLCARPRACRL